MKHAEKEGCGEFAHASFAVAAGRPHRATVRWLTLALSPPLSVPTQSYKSKQSPLDSHRRAARPTRTHAHDNRVRRECRALVALRTTSPRSSQRSPFVRRTLARPPARLQQPPTRASAHPQRNSHHGRPSRPPPRHRSCRRRPRPSRRTSLSRQLSQQQCSSRARRVGRAAPCRPRLAAPQARDDDRRRPARQPDL